MTGESVDVEALHHQFTSSKPGRVAGTYTNVAGCACGAEFEWYARNDLHHRHLMDEVYAAGSAAATARAEAAEAREAALRAGVEALAVSMGGIGAHREPCRLPDTECLCGVCDHRAEAAGLVRALLATGGAE